MEIAVATLEDVEAIISLQRLCYQSEAKLYNDWTLPALTQTVESLAQEFIGSMILKATANEKIVGSVRGRVELGICKIGRLIVHPEWQRQGIGSRLLRQIELRNQHVDQFELFTGSKSKDNIFLYQQHGYTLAQTEALSATLSIVYMLKPSEANASSSIR